MVLEKKPGEKLQEIALEWFEKNTKTWAPAHSAKVYVILKKNVFPFLGECEIDAIEPIEILQILQRIEARGAVDLAHRTRGIIGQIFRFAIATVRAKYNPAADLIGAIPPAKKNHYPAPTEPKEVAAMLRAFDAFTGSAPVRAALLLAPLVFVRPGELRKMEWAELDFDEKLWMIPAEKMKTRQAHIVPLSRQAIEILRDVPELGKYVFPGRTSARAMSEAAINAALRRLGFCTKTEITGHGFRAIARTMLHERLNFDPIVIEHQLAHAVPDALGRAYNRTKFLDKRREMMQIWADYLDDLKANF